jgi:hypothetical protein
MAGYSRICRRRPGSARNRDSLAAYHYWFSAYTSNLKVCGGYCNYVTLVPVGSVFMPFNPTRESGFFDSSGDPCATTTSTTTTSSPSTTTTPVATTVLAPP